MLKVQPVSVQQPSFQKRNTIERLKDAEEKFDRLENGDMSAEEQAQMLGDFIDKEKTPKFLKYFMATAALALTAFITAKAIASKGVKLVDKKLPAYTDGIAKKANDLLEFVAKKLGGRDENGKVILKDSKGFKAMLQNVGAKTANAFETFAAKGVDEDATKLAKTKNGLFKFASTATGAVGAATTIKETSKDEDGNSEPDAFQARTPDVKDALVGLAKAATRADGDGFIEALM